MLPSMLVSLEVLFEVGHLSCGLGEEETERHLGSGDGRGGWRDVRAATVARMMHGGAEMVRIVRNAWRG